MQTHNESVGVHKDISRRSFLRRTAMTGLSLATISPVVGLNNVFGQTISPLVIVIGSDPPTLDPHKSGGYSSSSLFSNIYEGLVERDAQGLIVPKLATEWFFEDDLNTVFTLREGVFFHNGEPFDANSAKTNLERARTDELLNLGLNPLIKPITNVEVLGEFELRISTAVPVPLLLALLTSFEILSPEFFENSNDFELNRMAVGTGPYELVEFVPDSHIEVKRFDGYWGEAPSIESAIIREAGPAARLAELLAGNADILANFLPNQIPAVENDENTSILTTSGNNFISSYFNLVDPESPLQNAEVRQALNLAVDMDAIVEFVWGGLGEPIATLVPPLDFGFNPEVEPFGFDPDEALRLLEQAGYPEGFSTTMVTIPGFQPIAEAIVGFLAEVNIIVDLQIRDFGLFLNQLLSGMLQEELFIFDSTSPEFDAATIFNGAINLLNLNLLLSKDTQTELRQLINIANSTTDTAVRQTAFARLQEILKDEPLAIYGFSQKVPFGLSERVNWAGRVDAYIRLPEINLK